MKILINYATVGGNSAMLAQQLMDKLKASHANIEFVYKDADECKDEDYSQYDLVIFVSSTWDDGDINMIAQEYLDGLKNVQGKKFALIGLGDSSYPHFCGAVPKTEEKLKKLGVQLVGQTFKVDGFIEEPVVVKATEWAEAILSSLQPGQTGQTGQTVAPPQQNNAPLTPAGTTATVSAQQTGIPAPSPQQTTVSKVVPAQSSVAAAPSIQPLAPNLPPVQSPASSEKSTVTAPSPVQSQLASTPKPSTQPSAAISKTQSSSQ